MVAITLRLPNADYRIEVDAASATSNTYNAVCQSVRDNKQIGAGDKSFTLRYKDDEGDLCIISSDEEMRECIRVLSIPVPGAGTISLRSAEVIVYVTINGGGSGSEAVPSAPPAAKTWVDPQLVTPTKPIGVDESFLLVDAKSTPAVAAAVAAAVAVAPSSNPFIAAMDAKHATVTVPVLSTVAPPDQPVHTNITCAVCRIMPITGVRFRCLTCFEAKSAVGCDFCAKCEDSHPTSHVMIKAKTAADFPSNTQIESLAGMLRAPLIVGSDAALSAAAAQDNAKTSTASGSAGSKERSAASKALDGRCTCNRLVKHTKICTCFESKLVADVNLPETNAGKIPPAVIVRGTTITKTWRVKNTGQRAWPRGVVLLHISGRGKLQSVAFSVSEAVTPKQLIDISATVAIPAEGTDPTARLFFRLAYTSEDELIMFGDRLWIDNAFASAAEAGKQQQVATANPAPPAADVKSVTPPAAAAPAPTVTKVSGAAGGAAAPAPYSGKFAAELAQLRGMGFTTQSEDMLLSLLFTAFARRGGFNLDWVIDQLTNK